jgi:hypothetical protein
LEIRREVRPIAAPAAAKPGTGSTLRDAGFRLLKLKEPGNVDAADAGTNVPLPASLDFMQTPPNSEDVQFRANCQPSFGGFPGPDVEAAAADVARVDEVEEERKFCGVLNARLYVKRKFWSFVGLKMTAARGEICVPSIWSFRSARSAPTSSNLSVIRPVYCTYPPSSVTLSMSSLRPLIVWPVCGFVKM